MDIYCIILQCFSYFQIVDNDPTFDLFVSVLFITFNSTFNCHSNNQELNLWLYFVILFFDHIFLVILNYHEFPKSFLQYRTFSKKCILSLFVIMECICVLAPVFRTLLLPKCELAAHFDFKWLFFYWKIKTWEVG